MSGFEISSIICSKCNNTFNFKLRVIKANQKRNGGLYICSSCAQKGHKHAQSTKDKIKQKSLLLHQDVRFKTNWKDGNDRWLNNIGDDYKKLMSRFGKQAWSDPEVKSRMLQRLKEIQSSPEWKLEASLRSKELWQDPDYYNKQVARSKEVWSRPDYQEKQAVARANRPSVSAIATTVYSMLDDLGVKYFREYNDKPNDVETIIGPWNFDCVVPRANKKTLLIEVQGEPHEFNEKRKVADRQKATYIESYFSDIYDLKYIWHYEFGSKDLIISKLKYWLDIERDLVEQFSFSDLTIRPITHQDCRLLLAKYHYLSNAVRYGIYFGAFLGDDLIALCVFSPLSRNNTSNRYKIDSKQIVELSRFCIHPSYQKYNFGSWFISRCIKQIKLLKQYKLIISYSDLTYNHSGSLYLASNFSLDGTIKSDYHYQKSDGWVMHKQTLYGKAKNLMMIESDYAIKFGYYKVFGLEKNRYLYWFDPIAKANYEKLKGIPQT